MEQTNRDELYKQAQKALFSRQHEDNKPRNFGQEYPEKEPDLFDEDKRRIAWESPILDRIREDMAYNSGVRLVNIFSNLKWSEYEVVHPK